VQPRDVVEGRFEIDRLAGAGGMGEVYRAVDRQTGAPVALKILHARNAESIERFAREAQLLAELSHPGIVRFIHSGTTRTGEGFLVMEWLDGEGLGDRLSRGRITIPEAVALGRRVAEALHAAHVRGVVHRDLKPQNLFLPGGDLANVKILDFGIARAIQQEQSITQTGASMGTPGFMSPEQAKASRDIDARADVFSLGCVLFKCLTGQAPFTGDPLTILLKVIKDPAPRVASLCPEVPPALEDLIQRMLAKSPDGRPRDAGAVAAELAALAPAPPPIKHEEAPSSITYQEAPPSIGYDASPSSLARGTPAMGGGTMALPAAQGTPSSASIASSLSPSALAIKAFPATMEPRVSVPPMEPRISVPPRPAPRRRRGGVIAVVSVIAVLGGAAAAVLRFVPGLTTSIAPGRAAPPAVATAASWPCTGVKCASIAFSDPSRVDAMEVLPHATQLAQAVEHAVTLCDMSLVGVVDGAVPIGADTHKVSGSAAISVRFAGWGAHGNEKGVDVSVLPGRLVANDGACTRAVAAPVCTPRGAYRAAVASGVPRGTPASMTYHTDETQGPIWEFFVLNHPEHLRRLDGRTCALKYKAPK
jgi:serine/threonine-protein kinase